MSVVSLNPLRATDAVSTVFQAQHRKPLAPLGEWDIASFSTLHLKPRAHSLKDASVLPS